MEQMLELTDEDAVTPELLDSQVQKAQEQLVQLRRQQEQIEKQKRELEELSRRQEELERGRAEMTDKLTRSLVVLEREAYETQNKLEQLRATRESFGQHLEISGRDRSERLEPGRFAPGIEPGAEHGGRCAGGVQSAAESFAGDRDAGFGRRAVAGSGARGGGNAWREVVWAMGFDRIRAFAAANNGWINRVGHLLVDGEGLRFRNDSASA